MPESEAIVELTHDGDGVVVDVMYVRVLESLRRVGNCQVYSGKSAEQTCNLNAAQRARWFRGLTMT